jgi:transcriptional regulator with XRE-family HTH domain
MLHKSAPLTSGRRITYHERVEPIYMRFGRELRRVRRKRRVTQATLADRIGLGRTSIVNIERGQQRVPLHTFVKLADALQVEPAELLPREPEQISEIAAQVEALPAPERDWVMRVVSPAAAGQAKRRRGAKA